MLKSITMQRSDWEVPRLQRLTTENLHSNFVKHFRLFATDEVARFKDVQMNEPFAF